jgi:hypothetical protein
MTGGHRAETDILPCAETSCGGKFGWQTAVTLCNRGQKYVVLEEQMIHTLNEFRCTSTCVSPCAKAKQWLFP